MVDFEDQETFEILMAELCQSPYFKVIFTSDQYGFEKNAQEIAWEASLAEAQGMVPITGSWNLKTGYFMFTTANSSNVAYYSPYNTSSA